MKRTVQTASFMNNAEHWKALNEIDAGVCEGMTYQVSELIEFFFTILLTSSIGGAAMLIGQKI